MTPLREELALITAKTLEHYNARAAEFWEGTRDHDVKQNIEALLRNMRGAPPFRILDFGCGVWEQDFLALKLPPDHFDGVFANASLFHVPRRELPRVLSELRATLKPDGVLFASNPRGTNEEGWNRGRYGVHHDLESWRAFLEAAAFSELEHYYRPPGLPLEQQPWLA